MAKKVASKSGSVKIQREESSGDVFKDFGYANPEEAKARWELAFLIKSVIKEKNLTQEQAATLMGLDQPKVSKIVKGLLSEFSIERLMKCLVALGIDIEIRAELNKDVEPSIHVSRPTHLKRLRIW